MSHSTGIKDRLNRKDFYINDIISYGKEELIAELTAAFVASLLGINSSIKEENVSYLNSWIKKIKEEPTYIFHILNDVNKNASYILNHL
jgi:Antirestriction protein